MTKTTLEEKWAEKKQAKLPLEEIYESGKKEGEWRTYRNRKLNSIRNFKNDEMEGEFIKYHENGKLSWKMTFKNGEKVK